MERHMKVEFGYGKGVQIVDIPDKNLDQILVANEIEHARRGPDAVVYALENPIGSPRLKDLAKPGQKIVIVTSDISRPLPSFDVIPSILDELYLAGCDPKDIKRCLRLVERELQKLMESPLSQQKLNVARRQLKGQIAVSYDNFESLAISMAKRYLHYSSTQTMQQLFNKLDELTPEQLHQTAQEVFSPQNLHTLIYK